MTATTVTTPYPRLSRGDTGRQDNMHDPAWMAIAAAHAMRFSDAKARFRWLYDYGAEPLTPHRAAASTATQPVLSHGRRTMLEHHFINHQNGNWDTWTRSDISKAPVWKAYLCPRYSHLGLLELRIGDLLADRRVAAFKTVTQRWMALRPDKFIVYFHDPLARAGWIDAACPSLKGIAANPVVFTKRIEGSDLITVATDPADAPEQSWRSDLLRRISELIAPSERLDRADLKARLRVAGIDPNTWESTNGPHI